MNEKLLLFLPASATMGQSFSGASSMATHEWYYLASGMLGDSETVGPVSEVELIDQARTGKLTRETLLSSPTRTHGQWYELRSVPGILQHLTHGEQEREEAKRAATDRRNALKIRAQAARAQLEREVAEHLRQQVGHLSHCTRPELVASIVERVRGLLTSQEVVEYVAVQQKPLINVSPDGAVATNRRLIIYRPKLLGRYSFEDFLWFDLFDAHVTQNFLGAVFEARHVSGRTVSLDYLPRESAEALYRIAQEREEQARLARHKVHVDTLRAGASQVNLQTNISTAAPNISGSATNDDLVGRLQRLKTMLDQGLITLDDFERRKQEILSEL